MKHWQINWEMGHVLHYNYNLHSLQLHTTLTTTTATTTIHYIRLHYSTQHDGTLHCTTLHYTTLITPHHNYNCNYATLIRLVFDCLSNAALV